MVEITSLKRMVTQELYFQEEGENKRLPRFLWSPLVSKLEFLAYWLVLTMFYLPFYTCHVPLNK